MNEVFLINAPVCEIVNQFPSIFDENMNDEIPTHNEAIQLISNAFAEGIKQYGKDKELLGELSEEWVRKQRYINMSLDDAIYSAFMEGATLTQPFRSLETNHQ